MSDHLTIALERQDAKTAHTLARLLGVSVNELAVLTLRLFLPANGEPGKQNIELLDLLVLYLDQRQFDTAAQAAGLKRRLDTFIGRIQREGSPAEFYTEVIETEGTFIVVLHHLGVEGWEALNGPLWGAKRKKFLDDNDNFLPPSKFD
jgi:hypothetical protein